MMSITRPFLVLTFSGVMLISCTSKKAIANGELDTSVSAKKAIEKHYDNAIDFETISGRVKIDYSDGRADSGTTVSLRMKKDEVIWISAPLGILKAKITPEKVSFYNKLEKEFFDGDFSYLSQLLGTELDFGQVQDLLLGNAVLDLRDRKYIAANTADTYGLKPKKENDLFKILFFLEPQNFRISSQQISQPWEDRFLKMAYSYQEVERKVLPNTVAIEAITEGTTNTIDLDFRNIEFNRKLNFPYRIPKGYKEIVLK
ncbi:MAG: DUF4292 domain-containing protein [Flavobacteriaceae bacterium]|nr:DUF4292 domain-containing protein [Flavobacteriaceae bacterium]